MAGGIVGKIYVFPSDNESAIPCPDIPEREATWKISLAAGTGASEHTSNTENYSSFRPGRTIKDCYILHRKTY